MSPAITQNSNETNRVVLPVIEHDLKLGTIALTLKGKNEEQENWELQVSVPVELSRTTHTYKAINKGLDFLRSYRKGKRWLVTTTTQYFSLA